MKIKDAKIYQLSDIAVEAQQKIQANFPDLDPIIGVSHNLRKSGFNADTMTIDNQKTDKRILIILHDDKPGSADIEFCYCSKDPNFDFTAVPLESLTQAKFYQWMQEKLR